MKKPARIQLSRAKGFDLQAASLAVNGRQARVVARPGRWGNPWKVENGRTAAEAAAQYRAALLGGRLDYTVTDVRMALSGKNLACWCGPDVRCHADVLIEIANGR